ncbi:MAG: fused MFS/spermidine synthase, partial [Candidatus Rokuibacteriota bacterium]
WAADGTRVRGNLGAVTALGAALALLGFLALAATPVTADWPVVSLTHRGIWLLVILSFALRLAPRRPRLPSLRFPPVAAFVTGAVVMILEIAGFRLLSPFFGYSTYVWGALLGTVMAALAAGYYVGGWLADRRSPEAALRASLLATAVLVLGTLYVYPAIVRLTVNLSLVGGSLAAATLLLFLPMAGLGMATPLLVRLAVRAGDVGVTVGRIYAAATVGSLAGTFAASFVLVTGLGPQESWAAAGIVHLGLLSAHGVARGGLAGVHWLGLLLVFAQPLAPEISVAALKGGTRIYETESEYSHLEVIELGKTLQLVPSLRFVHTIYDEDRILDPVMTYGLLPSFLVDQPRTMLHLGMGGGTLSRAYLHAHPEIRVHGVDIDREMVRLGRRFLGLRDDPRLSIFIEDARAYLARAPAPRYDVLVWDLFQGGVFVPYYALTREFFESARERLTERGVLALFIARPRTASASVRDRYARLYESVGNTLAAVFPSVAAYPVTRIGYYFVATRDPMSLETVRARLAAADQEAVHGPLRAALRGLVEYRPDPSVPVLTDDLAPVDQLIYDAFFRQGDD